MRSAVVFGGDREGREVAPVVDLARLMMARHLIDLVASRMRSPRALVIIALRSDPARQDQQLRTVAPGLP